MFFLLRTLNVGKTVVTDFRCKGIWIKEGYAIKQVKKRIAFGKPSEAAYLKVKSDRQKSKMNYRKNHKHITTKIKSTLSQKSTGQDSLGYNRFGIGIMPVIIATC